MEKKILVGVEIECETNESRMPENLRSYGVMVAGWMAKTDGSLRITKFLSTGNTREFVQTRPCHLENFPTVLEKFINFFRKQDGETYELCDVFNFNEYTGAHIHFSVPGKTFHKWALPESYSFARERFFQLLDESGKFTDSQLKKMKSSYYRNYARKYIPISEREIDLPSGSYMYGNANPSGFTGLGKYMEFNFSSEIDRNKGLEWRSPAIRDITTWEQLRAFYVCVLQVVKELCDKVFTINETESVAIKAMSNPAIKNTKEKVINTYRTSASFKEKVCKKYKSNEPILIKKKAITKFDIALTEGIQNV